MVETYKKTLKLRCLGPLLAKIYSESVRIFHGMKTRAMTTQNLKISFDDLIYANQACGALADFICCLSTYEKFCLSEERNACCCC